MPRRARLAVAVTITVLTGAVAGCGQPGPASRTGATGDGACPVDPAAPHVLAAADRRAPAVATSGDGSQVAAWESRTGGPVEAAVRPPGGEWSPTRPVGGPNAFGPVAGVAAGLAVVAWEGSAAGDRVVSAAASRDGRWSVPVVLSRPAGRASQPAAAAVGDAVVVGWTEQDPAAVVTAEITGAGTGDATVLASGGEAVSRLRLAATGDGRVVALWLRDSDGGRVVEGAVRAPTGDWSSPTRLSGPADDASDPVLAGGAGAAVAAWRTAEGRRGLRVVARVLDGEQWSDVRQLTAGVELPRGEARSDVGSVAPAAAVGASGTAVVAWPQRRHSREEVLTATWSATAGWSPVRPVPGPSEEQAGSPAVTVDAAGRPAVAWESLTGDRQTVRVAVAGGIGCALTRAGREASAPRLAPGPDGSVTTVWVDVNRGAIGTADVPGSRAGG
ncbi:MAG: hypothetical protein ACFCVF_00650 [Kineosporiaceae bacterium]